MYQYTNCLQVGGRSSLVHHMQESLLHSLMYSGRRILQKVANITLQVRVLQAAEVALDKDQQLNEGQIDRIIEVKWAGLTVNGSYF